MHAEGAALSQSASAAAAVRALLVADPESRDGLYMRCRPARTRSHRRCARDARPVGSALCGRCRPSVG